MIEEAGTNVGKTEKQDSPRDIRTRQAFKIHT